MGGGDTTASERYWVTASQHAQTRANAKPGKKKKEEGEFGHFGETAMGIENPLFIAANPTFGRWARTKGDEGKVSSSSTNEK